MSEHKLRRILGVWDGLAVAVGLVIGVGILRTPGLIASYLGDPTFIMMVWAFGGFVAFISAMAFAEMAAMLPEAGGKFAYARAAFGPVGGFVADAVELANVFGFAIEIDQAGPAALHAPGELH